MPHIPISSLRFRLLILVLVAILPVLVLLIITAGDQRQKALADAKADAVLLARLAAREQEKLIKDTQRLLTDPANSDQLSLHDAMGCGDFFAVLLKQNSIYTNLGAVGPDGVKICSGVPIERPESAANQAWFQRAVRNARFSIGNYQVDRITGEASLVFGQPILDNAGRVEAVVFAVVPVTWLNRLVNVAELPEDWTVTLLDQQGRILAHYPNPETWVGQIPDYGQLVRTGLGDSGEGTAVVRDLEDIPRVYGVTSLRGTLQSGDVFVGVGVPKAFAFAEADRVLRRNLLWLGVTTALAMLIAWVCGDLLIRRNVMILVRAAHRLSDDDLTVRTGPPYSSGELGQLSRAFDQMATALEMRAAETKRAEESMEQRVREVTALNQLFQQYLKEHVGFVGKFRTLLDELSTNPGELDIILQRARAQPLPNVAGLLDAAPRDVRDNPEA